MPYIVFANTPVEEKSSNLSERMVFGYLAVLRVFAVNGDYVAVLLICLMRAEMCYLFRSFEGRSFYTERRDLVQFKRERNRDRSAKLFVFRASRIE